MQMKIPVIVVLLAIGSSHAFLVEVLYPSLRFKSQDTGCGNRKCLPVTHCPKQNGIMTNNGCCDYCYIQNNIGGHCSYVNFDPFVHPYLQDCKPGLVCSKGECQIGY